MVIKYPVKERRIDVPFWEDFSNDEVRGSFYEHFNNHHPGIDFKIKVGTPVYASFNGIVVRKEFHKGMGNVLGVRNGNIVALYAHLLNFKTKLGKIIKSGDLLGFSGNTGSACPYPHLHFELRDISIPLLKDMVFKPSFNKNINNFTPVFSYTVNNLNTKKTLKSLSLLYFGTDKFWGEIKKINKIQLDGDTVLKQGSKITIPNYK